MASMFTPKVSSSFVFLYKIFLILFISAFFLSSRAILMPSLEDSFVMSVTSASFFVSISSTISEINFPMLAPIMVYGISVITSLSLSLFFAAGSNSTLPRSLIFPVPDSYIFKSSLLFTTSPPVGKSGPMIYSIRFSFVMSLLSIYAAMASITSHKLCVGMLVVMPTAIPSAPFIRILGTFTGSTTGSFSVSSKFGPKSTTFLSRSARYTSWVNFLSFASVYRMAAAPSPSMEPKFP